MKFTEHQLEIMSAKKFWMDKWYDGLKAEIDAYEKQTEECFDTWLRFGGESESYKKPQLRQSWMEYIIDEWIKKRPFDFKVSKSMLMQLCGVEKRVQGFTEKTQD